MKSLEVVAVADQPCCWEIILKLTNINLDVIWISSTGVIMPLWFFNQLYEVIVEICNGEVKVVLNILLFL